MLYFYVLSDIHLSIYGKKEKVNMKICPNKELALKYETKRHSVPPKLSCVE